MRVVTTCANIINDASRIMALYCIIGAQISVVLICSAGIQSTVTDVTVTFFSEAPLMQLD